ncbi:hypothetical protein MXB_4423, partial [Myxobolus squamalis]
MRFPVFGFLFGLFIVISLSFIFPTFAISEFPLYPKITTKLAIFLIFTISGMKIPFDNLRQNILSIKIMFFSLVCTFIFYPIAGVSIGYLMYMAGVPWEITRGFVVATCMPPPVSAGIIVTDLYYGDEALAVTISAVGNILAAVISPGLILLIVSGSLGFSISQSIQGAALIFFIFIVPILFGQFLRWCLPNSILKRYKTTLGVLGKVLLLYLVYCGISLSLDSSANSNVTIVMVGIIILFICSIHGLACLFILACDYNYFISGGQKKRIALMFSSSMKSLSAGVTIILLLSEKDKEFLSYMLPLIMFEPLQITQSIFIGMYFRSSE